MNALLREKSFSDLFPPPEFLLLSTSGISITDDSIKFVRLRRGLLGGGFKLEHLSRVKPPTGSVESGIINNPSELVSALKDISEHQDIRFVRATLPEEKAYLFTTSIDKVPASSLYDAVAFIVEENVPITLAESVFDFEIIGEDKGAGKIKVAVTVLPKNVVDAYVDVFEQAGMTPVAFDTESQAIARAIIPRGDKRPYLIIRLSLKKTGFYVVEDEVVQFTTTPSYGVGEGESPENLENLKSEMRKVIGFWNAKLGNSGNGAQKIEKIIVCGIGAEKKDLVNALVSESGIEHEIADIWTNAPKLDGKKSKSDDASPDYAPAIGLIISHKDV